MKYRRMGSLDWEVSALGFGAMRLPVKESWDNIDFERANQMVNYAIENGVNYFDTAWIYHGQKSEEFLGNALKNGLREKVKIATKSPIWLVQKTADFQSFLEQQLARLKTSYLDVYLIHGLNENKWEKVKQLNILHELDRLKSTGKIRHAGFSFHGSSENFKEIVNAYPWDVVQIQYNYLDTDFQAAISGLEHAYSKNMAVVIMEPLRGGKLAQSNPEINQILKASPVKRTLVDWALQFIWNHPGVSTVLSGMSNLHQLKENVIYASQSKSGSLSLIESETIKKLQQAYSKKIKVPCNNCKYCMPCPQGVDIPENLNLINNAAWEGEVQDWIKNWYNEMDSEDISTDWHGKGKASLCTECGDCLDKCPQGIDIPNELIDVKRVFEEQVDISQII